MASFCKKNVFSVKCVFQVNLQI